jgi:hypothetical protein
MAGKPADGLTWPAAEAWLRSTYRLPVGAAQKFLADALEALTVRYWREPTRVILPDSPDQPLRYEWVPPDEGTKLSLSDLEWQIEQWLGPPPTSARPEKGTTPTERRGGRPPTVRDEIEPWFEALSPKKRSLGSEKLAGSYKAEGRSGSLGHVRKVIAKLQRR